MVPVTGGGGMAGGTSAGGTTRHTVEVATKITADTSQASRATQELTRQTERLGQAQRAAQTQPAGSVGRPVPPGAGAAQAALAPRGGIGAAVGNVWAATGVPGMLGAAATPAAAAYGLMQFYRALDQVDNHALSTHEKLRQLAGSIPLVGQAMFDTVEMLRARMATGADYGIARDNAAALPYRLANQQAEGAGRFQRRSVEMEGMSAGIRADVYRTYRSPYQVNRYGEIDAEVDPERRAYLRQLQDAERGVAGAARERAVAGREALLAVGEAAARRSEAEKAYRAAQDQTKRRAAALGEAEQMGAGNWARNPAVSVLTGAGTIRSASEWMGQGDPFAVAQDAQKRLQAQREYDAALKRESEAKQAMEHYTQRELEAKSKVTTLAQKQLELDQARLRVVQVMADYADRQKAKTESAAADFTLLPPDQQQRIANAARRFKEVGIDGLKEEDREALQGFGPAQEALRNAALADARARAGQPNDLLTQAMDSLGQPGMKRAAFDARVKRAEADEAGAAAEVKMAANMEQFLDAWMNKMLVLIDQRVRASNYERDRQQDAGKMMFKAGA